MYTLRFPFNLPINREIDLVEESGEIGGHSFSLKKYDCT